MWCINIIFQWSKLTLNFYSLSVVDSMTDDEPFPTNLSHVITGETKGVGKGVNSRCSFLIPCKLSLSRDRQGDMKNGKTLVGDARTWYWGWKSQRFTPFLFIVMEWSTGVFIQQVGLLTLVYHKYPTYSILPECMVLFGTSSWHSDLLEIFPDRLKNRRRMDTCWWESRDLVVEGRKEGGLE